ncbi:MAG: N-acetylmuramoyl-L-alanine amidase [Pseudomonadaceae bacterium]|nr:N-acetylmuramoyl-L-alanine amidase [Pseudomonadaceae bacterium]
MFVKAHNPLLLAVLCAAVLLLAASVSADGLRGIRSHQAPDYTRLVLDTQAPVRYELFTLDNPSRVVVDLFDVTAVRGFDTDVLSSNRDVKNIRGHARGNGYRVVLDMNRTLTPKHFTLAPVAPYGHRLVVDLVDATAKPARPPQAPKQNRDVLVAIDAGHGGEDPGAIGQGKVYEKQVVLSIAREIERLIDAAPGFDAFLVRTGDYYIALPDRTRIAREQRADLFVSIHADAFKSSEVTGASVYTLSNSGATSEQARWLADRENASDLIGGVGSVSLDDKDPLLAKVLWELSMDASQASSLAAAESVADELSKVTKLHKRRIEQAGFVVLKSPDMPSILVETGYLSNPSEARRLSQREHQRKVAKAISAGIQAYLKAEPPTGTLLANRSSSEPRRYRIEPGDTLSEIAMRYGVSTRALRSANSLANDRLRIGQVLVIPTS